MVEDPQRDSDTVLHQSAVEAVASDVATEVSGDVAEEMLDGIEDENEAIADLVAITGGQSPTEAEHNSVISTVNDILTVLRSSHVIPS
jgi:hypothetical protein